MRGFCSMQEEESTRQRKCFNNVAAFSFSLLLVLAFAAIHSIRPKIKKASGFVRISSTAAVLSQASCLSSNISCPAESLAPPWMTGLRGISKQPHCQNVGWYASTRKRATLNVDLRGNGLLWGSGRPLEWHCHVSLRGHVNESNIDCKRMADSS